MLKKLTSAMVATMMATAVLLTGCSGGGAAATATPTVANPTSTPTASPTETTPVDSSITVALSTVGNTLDPAVANSTNTSSIVNHIYDRIVDIDETFNFIPGVASDWTEVDNITWELTIKDGVKFHNGDDLKLEDIKYSMDRLENITQSAASYSNVRDIEIVEPNKVVIHFSEPNSTSFRDLMSAAVVVNKAYCESAGDKYANEPVGTGPYVLKEFVPGSKVVLSAWEDYPFEKSSVETLTFAAIEEGASRYIALETGEADVAVIVYQDYERAKSNNKLKLYETTTTNTGFISMNTSKAPFDNTNVRRAIAYASNKEGFAAIKGGAVAIDSMVPSMLDIYYKSPDLPAYDLDKAKELLEEEGYNDSNPLAFEAWIYSGSDPVVEALQADLKSIGVNMTIKSLEFGVFLEGMANGEYELLLGSWNNVSGNELSPLANYWTGSFGSENISFYDNPRCDELYTMAVAVTDRDELIEIAKEIQEIAAQDVPMIPTFSQVNYTAANSNIEKIKLYTGGTISFRNAEVK